jgi:AAA+ ATPase superfamily predicted ATPase
MEKLIGREAEKNILENALTSKEAELIAVYGRRRVGKTFLIRAVYADHLRFELSGIHKAKLNEQLQNFSLSLQRAADSALAFAVPKNWISAFDMLQQFLAT